MKKTMWIVGLGVVALACFLAVRQRDGKTGHASGLSKDFGVRRPDAALESGADELLATKERIENKEGAAGMNLNVGQAFQPAQGGGGQAESAAPQELSAPVKALLLQDGKKHNYATLLAEIAKLGYDLSSADVAALMEMLAWSNDQFPEKMRAIEINAVKNDVLDKLLRQESMPEGLGLSLVQMAQNAENDSVWRDYCVQFMDPCYARLAGELPADDADSADQESHQSVSSVGQQEQIREAMFAALDERGDTLAGTALIGLENLSRTYDEFDRELIAEKAVEIAADDLASTESRLTALRLSATGNLKLETGNLKLATVETARELAQTGETVYMRSAAIVTLGEVGTEDDRELLESFALSDNRQIVAAAKMALAKMDAD